MIESIAFVLTGLGLAASIIYYAKVLENSNKMRALALKAQETALETRQTNILMGLYREWGTEEYQDASWAVIGLEYEDIEDYESKYGSVNENSELNQKIFRVGWFFNGIGVLVHRGLADIALVDDMFGYMVVWLWEIIAPVFRHARKLAVQPKSLEWFEYLYIEVKKYREENPELAP